MEHIEGKNYLTVAEIVERLKICRQTVMNYKKQGRLDFINLKGRFYITEESYNSLFITQSHKLKLN